MTVLGDPVPRLEGRQKVTGAAEYAADTAGQAEALTAWVVQAPTAKGRILRIEVDEVLAMPGVVAVLTHENALRLHDAHVPELLVLQTPEIRYRGEPVALVIAETLETARAAAGALRVEVEAADAHWFLDPDAPTLFPPDEVNGALPPDTAEGDTTAALAAAPAVVAAEYRTPAQVNHPLEPHSAVAWQGDDRLELVEATQGPSIAAQTLRALLDLPPDGLRLTCEHVGGGFGAKGSPKPDLPLAAMAAIVTGRRVKLVYHRRWLPTIGGYRSPTVSRIRLGADLDGTLVAVEHEAVAQTGTFGVFAEQTADFTRHLYAAPNRRTSHRLQPLDVPIPRFMRAPGEAPGSFALESAMDELAERLGMDPIELRIRNEPDEDPTDHVPFSTRNLVGCLRRGAERFGWTPRPGGPRLRREGRFAIGEGVAASAYPARVQRSAARATAFPDGTFEAAIAASDIGTGSRTVLAQVAADALGVPMDRVRMRIADSTLPFGAIGAGSFGTESWGWAVHKACTRLAERLAAGVGVPPDGLVVETDTEEDVAHLPERSRHAYGAQFVRLRVDLDSGEVLVDRMLGVFAAGRILNARTAHSQLIGGMTWGIGMALTESAEIDPVFGDVANPDFALYHVAACADVRELEGEWLDEPGEDLTPLGGKGLGELGIVGAAAAIANAVHDATGVRVRELPIRPDSLIAALPARFRRGSDR
jgi:xanthine dehydrogenase YagR molybdenum-binding subunit